MHSVLQSPLFHDIVTINLEEQHSLLLDQLSSIVIEKRSRNTRHGKIDIRNHPEKELKITKGLICIDQEKEYVESVGLSKIIK